MNAHLSEQALNRGGIQPYEEKIQNTLDNVSHLVEFVQGEHFDLGVLHRFWRGEQRAVLAVQTIGRLLGFSLAEELQGIRDTLERALAFDLLEFNHSASPYLFETIEALQPRAAVEDYRTQVEQLHYAADVRQTVLQHVVTSLSQRYQMPRFRDLNEASRWTEAYSSNLQAAERVIQGTRELLRHEMDATRAYLLHISREIERIEAAAEARLGMVKRLRWVNNLEAAEEAIQNHLAERAAQMEAVTFSILTESRGPGFLEGLVQSTMRRAPKLALLLLSLAGTGAALQSIPKLKGESVVPLPEPVRGDSNPADTGRLTALAASETEIGQRSARYTTAAVQQLVTDVQATEQAAQQGAQTRDRVNQFFNTLESKQGRQTLVIQNQQDLEKLLGRLTVYGYQENDVLGLLGLTSVESFTHPLTLDVRPGRQQPILFPYSADAQLTAPQSAIITQSVPASEAAQQTARIPALAPNEAFIVYRVQPNESLEQIATRYGLSVEQVAQDNQLAQPSVARSQTLLIRRPSAPSTAVGQGPTLRSPYFRSSGSFAQATSQEESQARSEPASVVSALPSEKGQAVIARYGDTLFPTIEAMPADARDYFVGTVQEVSDFFDVRPGDVMGILRLEQNNAGWRLQENRVSSAGASGVAQIVPRTWNGWASPEHENYVQNMLEIEQHGGLGFDWAKREEWRAWKAGQADRSVLQDSQASPHLFENSVAGVARHLANWGLTRDFAERDPQAFAQKLADAIAVYNSGRPLSVSQDWVQSSSNQKTTAQYVAEAMATSEAVARYVAQPAAVAVGGPQAVQYYQESFQRLYDLSFGILLSNEQTLSFLTSDRTLFEQVRQGKMEPERGAVQLLREIEGHYIAQGRAAIKAGAERPWPFVHNEDTLFAQKSAIAYLGRTLTLYEMDDLMYRTRADRDQVRQELMSRADARLFIQAKHLYNQMLERSERGLPVYNSEVAQLVQPLLAGHSPHSMGQEVLFELADQLQTRIASLDEYKQLRGAGRFSANPLSPMPEIFKDFGVPVSYQAGGRHTGVDLANPRTVRGEEPLLYAVDDATVVHVGPLYCDVPNACRGGQSIVLDHGGQVYSIYSHNSEATVKVGEKVTAGQPIGRQGSEGFSYGSHLHFEVHVGAPYSGNWQSPFTGGEFVDPRPWLPASNGH